MRVMTVAGRSWLVCFMAMGAVTVGCGGDDNTPHTGKHDVWFMGAVVDGAKGTPITTYTITLVSGTNTTKGKVDATTGRFTLGPLDAWNDYGVVIESDGFRRFSSYNAGIAPPTLGGSGSTTADIYTADTTQTFNFNASLFPMALTSPDIAITVVGAPMMPPSGSIRLQPTSQPGLLNQPSEVAGQAWNNDNDLYAAALSATFTNGTYNAPGASLVYGVSYTVSVYGVDGFQPTSTTQNPVTVQAGVNSGIMVTLAQQLVPPPVLVSSTAAACRAPTALTDTSSAVVALTFNVPINDGTPSAGGGAEALDNGLSVVFSPLSTSNLAFSSSTTMQERGTSFSINGSVLTLSWNANVGITTKGSGDTVRSVTYGQLNNVFVQADKHPDSRVSLGSLLPNNFITCAAAP
jgi:hypothetical protein